MAPAEIDASISVREAAAALGVTGKTVKRMLARGRLAGFKSGNAGPTSPLQVYVWSIHEYQAENRTEARVVTVTPTRRPRRRKPTARQREAFAYLKRVGAWPRGHKTPH